MKFSAVLIIYNPRSTGRSERAAKQLQRELREKRPDLAVDLMPTHYAGHAEELAYESARKFKHPLLISSSGDGGYHELINGALRAQAEGFQPVCAVLPAGNANDHARTMQSAPLLALILKGDVTKLDVLKVRLVHQKAESLRYAHSYIGFGFTPEVATELNLRAVNRFIETWSVLKSFLKLRPVRMQIDGRRYELDSLICSNIPEMGKVLTISKNAKADDGIFELIMQRHGYKPKLFLHLFKGTFLEFGVTRQARNLTIKTLSTAAMQLDGEVRLCKRGSRLTITCEKRALRTLI